MKITITIIIAIVAIAVTLAFRLRTSMRADSDRITSPVDLNTPVSNPKLLMAMQDDLTASTDATKNRLVTELNCAVFLVAALTDEATISPTEEEMQVTIKQGSLLKILTVRDDSGKSFLPLFTDWEQIKKYTDMKVTGMIMPAMEAWRFSLNDLTYDGVVINPAGSALPIDRNIIEILTKEE